MAKAIEEYLKILGLEEVPEDESTLKKAYHEKAKILHPDYNKDKKDYFTKRMQELNEAREQIKEIMNNQESSEDRTIKAITAGIIGKEPIDDLKEKIKEYVRIITYDTYKDSKNRATAKLSEIITTYKNMVKYTSKQNINDILEKLYKEIYSAFCKSSNSEFQHQVMTLYEAIFLNFISNDTSFTIEIIEFLIGKLAKIMNSEDYLFMKNNEPVTVFLLICYAEMINSNIDNKTSQCVLDCLFKEIKRTYHRREKFLYINSDYEKCIEMGIYNIFMKLSDDKKYLMKKIDENKSDQPMLNLLKKLIRNKYTPPKSDPPPSSPRGRSHGQ